MRYGLFALPAPGSGLGHLQRQFELAESLGLSSAWLANIAAADAMTALALAGATTSTIELGTFVVPTYPRHPAAMAQQALTTQAATNNRFVLGIGLSHRVSMERLGLSWDHPIRHMREYLSCLMPLLRQEVTTFEGEEYRIDGYQLTLPGAEMPQVIVAALGPQMLRLTGRRADGTAIWMGGANYIGEHAVPEISKAATDAGRPAPRIVAGLPICVTNDGDTVRAWANRAYERYGELPSYRAILDREGADGPGDVALIGTEQEVLAGLKRLEDAGVTDFAAAVSIPRDVDPQPTYDLLQGLAAG